MERGRRWVVLLVLAGLTLPATATAQQTLAPPGKAGADQYFETVPSASGNAAPPNGTAHGGSPNAGIRSLERLGKEGAAAGALAAATGPPDTPRGSSPTAASGRPPLASFTHVLGGSDAGGIGLILAILLASALVLAIAVALAKRRRHGEPT